MLRPSETSGREGRLVVVRVGQFQPAGWGRRSAVVLGVFLGSCHKDAGLR